MPGCAFNGELNRSEVAPIALMISDTSIGGVDQWFLKLSLLPEHVSCAHVVATPMASCSEVSSQGLVFQYHRQTSVAHVLVRDAMQ